MLYYKYIKEGGVSMDLAQLISQVGFPIAVATYTLVKLNKTIEQNTAVMIKIASKLEVDSSCTTKED